MMFLIVLLPFRLKQRLPTHSPLVTCDKWSFKCREWSKNVANGRHMWRMSVFPIIWIKSRIPQLFLKFLKNLEKDAISASFFISFHFHFFSTIYTTLSSFNYVPKLGRITRLNSHNCNCEKLCWASLD